jgi:hypothetical protein
MRMWVEWQRHDPPHTYKIDHNFWVFIKKTLLTLTVHSENFPAHLGRSGAIASATLTSALALSSKNLRRAVVVMITAAFPERLHVALVPIDAAADRLNTFALRFTQSGHEPDL